MDTQTWVTRIERLKQLRNDVRARSVITGILGGLLGWLMSEVLVGEATTTLEAAVVGLVVGAAIGAALSSAEGIAVHSWSLAKQGAKVGMMVGAMGGVLGAILGQTSYAIASGANDAGVGQTRGTLFNPELRKRLQDAGAHEGIVEIALSWNNKNDLDLHVVDPPGEEIYFSHKRSVKSGGELDVDRNVHLNTATEKPVEHVYFPKDGAPMGSYSVYVHYYHRHAGQPNETPYQVDVLVDGQLAHFEGTLREEDRDKRLVHAFERQLKERIAVRKGSGLASLFAVALGWTVFGASVGLAEGLRRRSPQTARNAVLGGAIGGAAGGVAIVVLIVGLSLGVIGRIFAFAMLGASIGYWIVVVQRALSAVLTVCNGRYEGREIFLDKKVMRLGRSDALEIYLGADPKIEPHHATLRQEEAGYVLQRMGGPVIVHGSQVAEHCLADGDSFTIGDTRLTYRHKKAVLQEGGQGNRQRGSVSTPAPARRTPPPPPPPPLPKRP